MYVWLGSLKICHRSQEHLARSSATQVVSEPQNFPEVSRVAGRLRNEYVVRVKGEVRMRKDPNTRLATGKVELVAHEVGTAWDDRGEGACGLIVATSMVGCRDV